MQSILLVAVFLVRFRLPWVLSRSRSGFGVTFYNENESEIYNVRNPWPWCTALPDWVVDTGVPNVATDICIKVYSESHDCPKFPIGRSKFVFPDDYVQHPIGIFEITLRSFRPCNYLEGSKQINVDVYSNTSLGELELIAQIRDLCSPQTFPNTATFVDNYGNCVELCDVENCREPLTLNPGELEYFEPNHYQFISPCKLPWHCHLIVGNVTKLYLDTREETLTPENIIINSWTEENAKYSTILHKFMAKAKFLEKVNTTLPFEEFNSVKSSAVLPSVEIIFKTGKFSTFVQNKISAGILAAFNFNRSEGDQTGFGQFVNTYTYNVTEEQEYTIPPCTSSEFTSYLRVLSNISIDYTITMRMRGWLGAKHQTDFKPHNFYDVHHEDEYTILAKANQKAKVDLVLGTFVTVKSVPMKVSRCRSNSIAGSTQTVVASVIFSVVVFLAKLI